MLSRRKIISAICACFLLCAAGFFTATIAAKDKPFSLPRAFHAKTYPAHDAHDDEQVTLALDPYDLPDKQATVFRANYLGKDILPVHFILSNDSGKMITLNNMNVLLITKKKLKLEPASTDDIYRRLAMVSRHYEEPNIRSSPIPLPRKAKSPVPKEALEEVPYAQFMVVGVEPKSTQAGFFFFDVENIENPLAGARLVVTGIRNSAGKELFYFEIPLEKYLGYKPGQ